MFENLKREVREFIDEAKEAWGNGFKKRVIGAFSLIAVLLIGVVSLTLWAMMKLAGIAWGWITSATGTVGSWIATLVVWVVRDFWVWLWSAYWNAKFWNNIQIYGDTQGWGPWIAKVAILLCVPFIVYWIFNVWSTRRTSKKAIQEKKDPKKKEARVNFIDRQREMKWKNMPFYILKVFHGSAVERFGTYVRVRKPGEIAQLDKHGTIQEYRPRLLGFLGGLYLKLPWLESVEDVYIGTRESRFRSISVNSAGVLEPEVKPMFEALEQSVAITTGKRIASANGPQVDGEFFFLWEVHQIVKWLRLDESIRKDVTRQVSDKGMETVSGFQARIIEPTVNNFLQDTLPDMLMGDIQRAPSSLFLIGTRDELRGRPAGGREIIREESLIEYWTGLMNDSHMPFYQIDDENLDSTDSRLVIDELMNNPTPYNDRNRRNCVLVSLMQSGGIRIRQFRKSEIEPESLIRDAITRKGVAQVDFETGVIESRKELAKELIKQQERIASAKTDAEKANIVVKDCNLPVEIKPYLITFFQQQRTREVMSKGAGTTFVIGEEMLSNLGGLIEKFMSQFNQAKK